MIITIVFLLIVDGNKMKIRDERILFQLELWDKKVSILGLLAKAIMVLLKPFGTPTTSAYSLERPRACILRTHKLRIGTLD